MDNELYELCKEVYKRTGGWGIEEKALTDHKLWHPEYSIPIYTSDYLLEKLPNTVELKKRDDGSYSGLMPSIVGRLTLADTPLKALLKLTIALSEAGELK